MNNSDKPYKAAIYCRLSEEDRFKTNKDDDSNSIINQKALLTMYCLDRGWMIYDIYSDDDFTGSDRSRPEFNRLLTDAESKKFDVVVCKTQSRFTRELELVEKYINYLLPVWGIRFVSVVDNADTAVKGNKKSRQINGLVNEWYLEDMSDNIRAVLTGRRRNGYFIGAFAPYGYKKDPARKGRLIIDEEAAVNVRLIFSLYLSGMGRTAIARELNSRRIPTPADYKTANGERYKNNCTAYSSHLWRYFMIARILTNEVYIGNLVQNKAHSISYKTKIIKPTQRSEWIRAENTHEPIIDIKTWETAQEILSSRQKPSFRSDNPNVFSKKAVCAECGKPLRMSKGSSAQNNRRYLRCPTRYYAPENCAGVAVGYNRLYDLVLGEFKELIPRLIDVDKAADGISFRERPQEMLNHCRHELERAKASVEENAKCLKNLYIDKIKGTISESDFMEFSAVFRADKEAGEKRVKQIENRIKSVSSEMRGPGSKPALVKDYIECKALTFEMVRIFVEKIVVHPKKPYSRSDSIEIYWKF